MLRGFQQLLQIWLPKGSPRMRTVSMALFGDRKQDKTALLHSFDVAFRNSEFRRIDEIIGRIYEHHWRRYSLQLRRGIVIPRSTHRVKQVVTIVARRKLFHEFGSCSLGCFAGGEVFL